MEKPHKCCRPRGEWEPLSSSFFLEQIFNLSDIQTECHGIWPISFLSFNFNFQFLLFVQLHHFFAKYQKFLLSVAFSDIILLSGPTAQRFHRRIWNCDLPLHSSEKLIYLRNSAKHTLSSNMLIIVMSFISTPYTWLIQPKHIYLKF